MSAAPSFRVKVIRPITIGPRRLLIGCEIAVDASTAVQLLRDGRVRLLDESDLGSLSELTRASNEPTTPNR